jgi:hypothetical protein
MLSAPPAWVAASTRLVTAQIGRALQHLPDALLVDHAGQPVRAEQKQVPVPDLPVETSTWTVSREALNEQRKTARFCS